MARVERVPFYKKISKYLEGKTVEHKKRKSRVQNPRLTLGSSPEYSNASETVKKMVQALHPSKKDKTK
jgi:hypothetical protein